jgi:hypothetical protein
MDLYIHSPIPAAVDRRCSSVPQTPQLKEHSTLKSLCRGTKGRSTLAKFARCSVRSVSLGNMVSTLRGKATNIASRGSRAQSIPGFRVYAYIHFALVILQRPITVAAYCKARSVFYHLHMGFTDSTAVRMDLSCT